MSRAEEVRQDGLKAVIGFPPPSSPKNIKIVSVPLKEVRLECDEVDGLCPQLILIEMVDHSIRNSRPKRTGMRSAVPSCFEITTGSLDGESRSAHELHVVLLGAGVGPEERPVMAILRCKLDLI
jgi:hypothetical protein